MGYALMIGSCINCKARISFNPMKVPSIKVEGAREPLCIDCANYLNKLKEDSGQQAVPIQPDAYQACKEEELT